MSPKDNESLSFENSYGGSEVLENQTRISLIHGNSMSFVLEDHDFDTWTYYTQYHSGLNYPQWLDVGRLSIFSMIYFITVLSQGC